MRRCSVALFLLVSGACASVPRDAGVAEVNAILAARSGQAVRWETSAADRARFASMLEDGLEADEAVAIALESSPRLQATLAAVGIARADLIEASTIANPLFEFELRFPGEPYRPYELRLAQSLVDLIQLPRRRQLGRAAFEAAQLRVSSEVLQFAAGTRRRYFDAVAAERQEEVSRTAYESAQTAAALALEQHRAENITDLDLENEQAVYEQAKLDHADARQGALAAREALARAMGLAEATSWALPATLPPLPPSDAEAAELEKLGSQQRLDVEIARREVDLARRAVPIARLAVLDELVVDVHYEREPEGTRTWGPGLEVPIPIFDTGKAARGRAEASYLRARLALEALLTESASQVRVAQSVLVLARARVEYYRDVIIPRRSRILELTRIEHNAMLTGVYQLLDAKKSALAAERDFIDAQRAYWLARVDLDAALAGIGSQSDPEAAETRGGRPAANRGGY